MTNTNEQIGQLISETTLKQLGGAGKLQAMVAAKNFTYDSEGTLSFHFKGSPRANIIKIKLNYLDLYNIEFHKYNSRTFDCECVAQMSNVGAWDLKSTFKDFTGLELSL